MRLVTFVCASVCHVRALTFESLDIIETQGRRHGFESGGTNSVSGASRNFFDPHFLASGQQNIA